jgi:hypothetical protein
LNARWTNVGLTKAGFSGSPVSRGGFLALLPRLGHLPRGHFLLDRGDELGVGRGKLRQELLHETLQLFPQLLAGQRPRVGRERLDPGD